MTNAEEGVRRGFTSETEDDDRFPSARSKRGDQCRRESAEAVIFRACSFLKAIFVILFGNNTFASGGLE
jgi:hypothetical protein